MLAYTISNDTVSITCGSCGRTSYHPDDVYFRYCTRCGLLGSESRQKWNEHRGLLRELCEVFGRYKMVMGPDSIRCRVPTEAILTEGIVGSDLERFPRWEDVA